MNRTDRLGSEKISKLLLNLSAPATVGMLVVALYNIADTIFIGKGIGTLAIAGVSVVFPIIMLITTMGQTIGVGGASIISRSLGAHDLENANKAFGNLISLIVILSIITTVISFVFINPILYIFGARGYIYQSALEYFFVLIPGLFFLNISMALNNVIRAEGNAKYAMMPMIISALINVGLDPIFIFGLNWGVAGAAWATVISQIAAFIYFIYYFKKGIGVLKIKYVFLKMDPSIIKETLAVGMSSFARHGSGSILAAILNNSLIVFGGELAVAAYGIINRILRVVFMPMIGLVQGFMPIVGFNYGAGNILRVKDSVKIATSWSTLFGLICYALLLLFAEETISIFTDDLELIGFSAYAMKIVILMLPLVGFQMIGGGYFQAIGKAKESLFLALLRQIIILVPLIIVLPLIFNLDGILYSFPIADLLATIITYKMIIPVLKHVDSHEHQ